MSFVRQSLRMLWQSSRSLTSVATLMVVAFVLSLAGIMIDDRVIGGAPAWQKPAKFAISTAIYSFTLAWVFTYLPEWRRLKRIAGFLTAAILVLEVAIIDVQAARGVASHFNLATSLDSTLYGIMGTAILIVWVLSVVVTIALFYQRFANGATGWAIRLGMLITVLGSATGGLMTKPTAMQMEAARAGHRLPAAGAHTVGGPDGLPGVPGTGWSRKHGDLRVPHFLGLHGAQAVPLIAWWFGRRKALRNSTVVVAAASYLSLCLLLFWQALRGQSVVAADTVMVAALLTWLAGTAAALAITVRESGAAPARDRVAAMR